MRRDIDAVKQRPRFRRIEHWRLPGRHDVRGPRTEPAGLSGITWPVTSQEWASPAGALFHHPDSPVADPRGARAGEIAQAFEHPLGAGFLNDGDQDRAARKNSEDDRFLEIAENKIDSGRAQQQREHRLAQDLEHDADKGSAVALGEGSAGRAGHVRSVRVVTRPAEEAVPKLERPRMPR